MKNNKTDIVYVVYKKEDFSNIEAVFASRESLQSYLKAQQIQFEKLLNDNSRKTEIHEVESMLDEGYEIIAKKPTFNIDVVCCKLDVTITPNNIKPVRVWIWASDCIAPFGQMKIFTSEEDAEEWMSTVDDPEELHFIEMHELQY